MLRIGGQVFIAVHAECRGVDQQAGIAEQFGSGAGAMRRDPGAEAVGQFARPLEGAVDDADVGNAALLQRVDHRPRGAAGTENHGGPGLLPARCKFVEIGGEAFGIGVAADKRVAFEPKRVDGANHLGRRIVADDRREGGFLVRDGHVAACKTLFAQAAREAGEILRRDVDRLIGPGDPVVLQPKAVDERRPRMGDRVAADEGPPAGFSHRSRPGRAAPSEPPAAAGRQW